MTHPRTLHQCGGSMRPSGVAHLDVWTLPVVATGPGPDVQVGPAVRAVLDANLSFVRTGRDHTHLEVGDRHELVLSVSL